MTVWLIEMFGISLILTILIEWGVTFLLGFRSAKKILLVLFVNVLTNPPAVLLHWLGGMYLRNSSDLWLQIMIEAAVVATEAMIYHNFSRKEQWQIQRPVLVSIAANTCSWVTGFFLTKVF